MPLKDMETEGGGDGEWEYACIHGKFDDEPCVDCDTDEELQSSGGDIYEDDDDDDDEDDDGGEEVAAGV